MMSYRLSAIDAVRIFSENKISPAQAWEKAVDIHFPDSISSREKGCPKNTFLGLCADGKVKNIPSGNYTNSKLNKRYGLTAVSILAMDNKEILSFELWHKVLKALQADENKRHNSQMNVVLALWNEGLILP